MYYSVNLSVQIRNGDNAIKSRQYDPSNTHPDINISSNTKQFTVIYSAN